MINKRCSTPSQFSVLAAMGDSQVSECSTLIGIRTQIEATPPPTALDVPSIGTLVNPEALMSRETMDTIMTTLMHLYGKNGVLWLSRKLRWRAVQHYTVETVDMLWLLSPWREYRVRSTAR